jgi:hypothetical protein
MFRAEQLVSRLLKRSGSPGYAILNVTAPVWPGDLVGIGKRDYVCVAEPDPTWPTDGSPRPVPLPEAESRLTPDAYLTALAAAINRDALAPVKAQRKSETELLCSGRGVRGRVTLSAVFTEAGNGWASAKLVGRQGQSTRPSLPWGVTRTIEDWEAAQGSAVVALRRWPRGFVVQVRGAAGELLAFDGNAKAVGRNVILTAKGAIALEAGMTITVIAY